MNADTLLKHFEKIAEAPDAIPRLRRFILDLAVRGKLVEQDPKDEPATKLLNNITKRKQHLIQGGTIKRDKPIPCVEESDMLFQVPLGWHWVRLGEITSYIQRGKSPVYAVENGVPVVSQKCVQWTGLNMGAARLITRESLQNYEDIRFLRTDDLLWNSTGTGTIGRIVRVVEPPKQLVCDSHVAVVRCLTVNAEYVRTWLRSDHVYGVIEEKASGSTNQVELTSQMTNLQIVPLPPLAEQHRIVAKVDELMALCDTLEAAQQQRESRRDRLVAASLHALNNGDDAEADARPSFADSTRFYLNHLPRLTTRPEHIKQLRQTILNLAVRGKLVPQDPKDEPAAELLSRIEADKVRLLKQGMVRRETPLDPVAENEGPLGIPATWEWERVGTCALLVEYGTSVKTFPREDGVPVLKMGNIQDGRVLLGEHGKVPRNIEDLPKLFLKRQDLLYNRTNSAELVGKTGIYLGDDDAYTFASYLIRIRFPANMLSPIFANLAMNAPYFRETQILPELKQQCGQANVNGTKLRNMLIPIPPLSEQHRIVAKANELMALCDALEADLTTAAATRRRLLEATLQEALS